MHSVKLNTWVKVLRTRHTDCIKIDFSLTLPRFCGLFCLFDLLIVT